MTMKRLALWLSIASLFLLIGGFSNWIVKEYNGSKMPVETTDPLVLHPHIPMDENTRFPWLGDWMKSPLPFSSGISSPGDILTYIGIVICGMCLSIRV